MLQNKPPSPPMAAAAASIRVAPPSANRHTAVTAPRAAAEDVLRILLVEDLTADAEFIERELRKGAQPFAMKRVENTADYLRDLDQFAPDIVLADYLLPQFSALEALQLLKAKELDIPFILVTGSQSEEVAVACMKEGADDYILKDRLARLPTAIANALANHNVERKRRAAIAALGRSAQQFQLITDNTHDIICLVDETGAILYVSPSCKQRLGYTPEEIIGSQAACLFSGEDAGEQVRGLREAILAGVPRRAEFRCQHKNGGWRSFESTGRWIADENGSKRRAVMVWRDATRRKRSDSLLRDALRDVKKREAALVAAVDELKTSHAELQSVQLQLIQAEKMESVGRLAAGVAHEVKNPLTVLLMGTEYLRKHLPKDNAELATVLEEMADSVSRANTVIRGLLDFSRPGMLELKLEDPHALLEQALVLVKHDVTRLNVEIVRDFAVDVPRLKLDRAKMEQVFVNLFTNAIHAMSDRGVLTLRTRVMTVSELGRLGQPGLNRDPGEKAVVVQVADTGTGIPAAKLTRIFDPFFTTKPTGTGTGLGLTVTQRIIDLHGGSIGIDNLATGGACATIALWPGGRRAG